MQVGCQDSHSSPQGRRCCYEQLPHANHDILGIDIARAKNLETTALTFPWQDVSSVTERLDELRTLTKLENSF